MITASMLFGAFIVGSVISIVAGIIGHLRESIGLSALGIIATLIFGVCAILCGVIASQPPPPTREQQISYCAQKGGYIMESSNNIISCIWKPELGQ